eukprot:375809_1
MGAPLPGGAPAPMPMGAPAPAPMGAPAPAPMGAPCPVPMMGGAAPPPLPPPMGGAAPPPLPMMGGPPLPGGPLMGLPGGPALNFGRMKPAAPPGRAPPKDKKMRGLQWNKLKGKALTASVFKDIKVNDDQIKLDFGLLDKLWCKPKKIKKEKKKKDKKDKKPKKRSKIAFLDEMDDGGKKARVANITIKAIKKSAEEYRDIILTMDINEEKDNAQDLVTAINKIVPNEDHMKKFEEHWKSNKYQLIDVKYFEVGERLWYYCRKIPLISLRCELWMFKLQFAELCDDQYKHINLLRSTFTGIDGNQDMFKVFELILAIGNYLNYGHKRNGGAKGIRLDIFDKLRDLKANKATAPGNGLAEKDQVPDMGTEKYTLLMYLVNMVNKEYPELAQWVKIFDNCKACIKIKTDELEKEVNSIDKKVKNLKDQLRRIEEEKRRMGKKKGKEETKEEETWEEPPAPDDVYEKVMVVFLREAEDGAKKLLDIFEDTVSKCNKLALSMGEKLSDKYTLCEFWQTLYTIKSHWWEADDALGKIEVKKAKAAAVKAKKAKRIAAKKKVAETLKRRPSKDVLKKRGVYKENIGHLALQNFRVEQIKQERKLNNASGTRHKSLYLAQTQYKCTHCDSVLQDVANLNNNSEDNIHCHQCYATPYDKEIKNLSLQWLPLGMRSSKCQFKHKGACIGIYDGRDQKKLTQLDKRKRLLHNHKAYGTTDDLTANSSLSNLLDINYDDMIYGRGLIESSDLIHNLDPKNKKQVLQKMVRGLKNWDKKNPKAKDSDKINKDFNDFWDDILSSDSSDSDPHSVIYDHQMKKKKHREGRHKTKNMYKKHKHDKHAMFTPNPHKREKQKKNSRVSFAGSDEEEKDSLTSIEMVKTIDFKKSKKRSVFLDTGGAASPNTIQREKLPARSRNSHFGLHHDKGKGTGTRKTQQLNPPSLLQRKHSTFNENAYGETFRLSQDQLEMIDSSGIMALVEQEMEKYGIVSFDKRNASLKLILGAAGDRLDAVEIIERHIGSITTNPNLNPLMTIQEPQGIELIFPLTDKQLKLVTNPMHLKMLVGDMAHFGTIGVHEGLLKLRIPPDLPTITPIHKLEKRLGVLMTTDEIKQIRDNIRGEKDNPEKPIDVLQMNDKDFINAMMTAVDRGVKFIKHKKRGVYDERYVLIHNDRLYWKEKQNERNHRSRSMHLTKIIQVMIGKNTKALKHETLAAIPPVCCFSVVAKKATLDLSTPTQDPIEIRKFTAYLKGLQRHFISQQTEFMAQTPHNRLQHQHSSRHQNKTQREQPNSAKSGKMKLSPIGQGFDGFKFDDQTLSKMSQ